MSSSKTGGGGQRPKEVCDQDAFDAIYTQYVVREQEQRRRRAKAGLPVSDDELDTNRVEERVRILRRDALNSDPPATLRQRSHNQVLHLMGEHVCEEISSKRLSKLCVVRLKRGKGTTVTCLRSLVLVNSVCTKELYLSIVRKHSNDWSG